MSTRNRIEFDSYGVCNACNWSQEKKTLDWDRREKEFKTIIDELKARKSAFDVIVPVSGGKDGSYVTHVLRDRYNLKVLNVTINPPLRTPLGHENLENFKKNDVSLIEINTPFEATQKLNRIGFVEQGRPLYGWVTSIFSSVLRIADALNIGLIMYGEDGEIEYGGSTESKNKAVFDPEFIKRVYLEGGYYDTLAQIDEKDRYFWEFGTGGNSVKLAHWSYFENWDSYRNYVVAKEMFGLKEKEKQNTGTYTNFSQNDTYLYDLHTYLMYLKFGFGRATQDVGIDIRRGSLSRQQGILLAELYDNHFPTEYIDSYLDYYQMSEKAFNETIDKFVNKELFNKNENGKWIPNFRIV